MNDLSATIFYNQRIAFSADVKEPVVWRCSKVEQVGPNGIDRLTFAQDVWDSQHDYIERDEYGKLIGIWCDYYSTRLEKTDVPDPVVPVSTTYSEITYSGAKPQLKVGGSYKKFTVTFYGSDGPIDHKLGLWTYKIDDEDVSNQLDIVAYGDDDKLDENQVKLKIPKDDSYIGKTLTISYLTPENINSSIDVEIVAL